MRTIQMVDLQTQYARLKNEIDTAIQNVLNKTAFINGPEVQEFSEALAAYTGSRFVIPCANGTDALQIAFMALDLQEGDEVITPAYSYAALAEVLHLLKLKPVYTEINSDDFLINASEIEKHITSKTKAIAPVHLYGQCANMEIILEIARKYNLFVIEDNAQAIGAQFTFSNGNIKQAGTMGTIGTTSFFPSKNLGCFGDGGAIFTQDENLAKKLKMIANHGQSVKYQHQIIGLNSRLDTLQAAVLIEKLKHLTSFCEARNSVADFYDSQLHTITGIEIPKRTENSTHVFHQYTLKLDENVDRNQLQEYLKTKNIPSMIYYPIPLHKQEAYSQNISLPISENLCKRVISLPISTEMDTEQLNYITQEIKEYFNQNHPQ